MHRLFLFACLLLAALPLRGASQLSPLRVSDNGRFLVTSDGQPFFWLADTAWELLHRLSREQVIEYLEIRARQRFNVVQTVALAQLDGLTDPNAHGDVPLLEFDPARPAVTPGHNPSVAAEYDYWDHVDFVVAEANRRGLYVALLPTWGSWAPSTRKDPRVIFTPDNAEAYGRFLGQRFARAGIVWVLGGDRDVTGHEAMWPRMARGIALGATGAERYDSLLMTFHPRGRFSSTLWFHGAPWLDFHMMQTGHNEIDDPSWITPWDQMAHDYALTPPKPVLDSEPLYEDHAIGFGKMRRAGYALDAHVRQRAYWAVFSGGFGHTYGHHSVWQMVDVGRKPINGPIVTWREALERPGAQQMQHVRALMESRPFLSRVPDPALVLDSLQGPDRIVTTRGEGYALVYTAQGRPFTVKLGVISGERVVAWWFNPRAGSAQRIGEFANQGTREFAPPNYGGFGADMVLVLDDAARGFPAPGARLHRP